MSLFPSAFLVDVGRLRQSYIISRSAGFQNRAFCQALKAAYCCQANPNPDPNFNSNLTPRSHSLKTSWVLECFIYIVRIFASLQTARTTMPEKTPENTWGYRCLRWNWE